MNEQTTYVLVKKELFAKFLKIIKQKGLLDTYDYEENQRLYVLDNTIVGFYNYFDDIKVTHYYINEMFIDILEGVNYE